MRALGSEPKPKAPPSSKRLKAARVASGGARDLPGLDYDSEVSARTRIAPPPKHLVEMTASPTLRARSKRFRWFVLGVLLGALIVSAVRGDATMSFRAARAWGASQLRALKKNPPVQLGPMSVATSIATPVPCDLTDEECATLLAPFAAANALPEQQEQQQQALASRPIPEVDVMSLKKVKPPVVYVAPPPKPAATVASEPLPEGDDAPLAPPSPASTSPAPIPADTGTPYAPRADMNGPLAVTPSPRVFIP